MSQYVTRCGICSKTLFFDTPEYPSPTLCQPCVVQAVEKHNDGEEKKDSLYAELEEIKDSANEAINAAEAMLCKNLLNPCGKLPLPLTVCPCCGAARSSSPRQHAKKRI